MGKTVQLLYMISAQAQKRSQWW